jgi:transposase
LSSVCCIIPSHGGEKIKEMTDEQWSTIQPFIPKQVGRGRPRADDRATLGAILYVLSTGCRWDDLSKTQYYHWYTTAWRRLKTWEENGVWKRILDALIARGYALDIVKLDSLSIDSTTVPAKKGASSLALTVTSAYRGRRSTRR